MRIIAKFNLVLISIMSIALTTAGYFSYNLLHENAKREVESHAEIMLEAALAIRSYTVGEIRPLLKAQMVHEFLPQSVPAYAATQSFNKLRKNDALVEYSYKEATINPTNPNNRAAGWEIDIINDFKRHPNKTKQINVRETSSGPLLHLSRPIKITKKGCLECHGNPNDAPDTMFVRYQSRTNGFGWHIDEIVGAQIITVPMSIPHAEALIAFYKFMGLLVGIFALIIIFLNVMLRRLIIRPVITMAAQANDISMGNMQSPEFPETGKDELSTLASSFNRMRRSLQKAMRMLEDNGPKYH